MKCRPKYGRPRPSGREKEEEEEEDEGEAELGGLIPLSSHRH